MEITTDRNPSVQKICREQFPETDNFNDTWHLRRSIVKRAQAVADKKGMHLRKPGKNSVPLNYCAFTFRKAYFLSDQDTFCRGKEEEEEGGRGLAQPTAWPSDELLFL
jgi:hypothetical protein